MQLRIKLTWTDITSSDISVRYTPEGYLFDAVGKRDIIYPQFASPVEIYLDDGVKANYQKLCNVYRKK